MARDEDPGKAVLLVEGLRLEDVDGEADADLAADLAAPSGLVGLLADDPAAASRILRLLATGQGGRVRSARLHGDGLGFEVPAATRGRRIFFLPRRWRLPALDDGESFLREVASLRGEAFDPDGAADFYEAAGLGPLRGQALCDWSDPLLERLAFGAAALSGAELLLLDRPLEEQIAPVGRALLAWAAMRSPRRCVLCHSLRLDLLDGACAGLVVGRRGRWLAGEAGELARRLGLPPDSALAALIGEGDGRAGAGAVAMAEGGIETASTGPDGEERP